MSPDKPKVRYQSLVADYNRLLDDAGQEGQTAKRSLEEAYVEAHRSAHYYANLIVNNNAMREALAREKPDKEKEERLEALWAGYDGSKVSADTQIDSVVDELSDLPRLNGNEFRVRPRICIDWNASIAALQNGNEQHRGLNYVQSRYGLITTTGVISIDFSGFQAEEGEALRLDQAMKRAIVRTYSRGLYKTFNLDKANSYKEVMQNADELCKRDREYRADCGKQFGPLMRDVVELRKRYLGEFLFSVARQEEGIVKVRPDFLNENGREIDHNLVCRIIGPSLPEDLVRLIDEQGAYPNMLSSKKMFFCLYFNPQTTEERILFAASKTWIDALEMLDQVYGGSLPRTEFEKQMPSFGQERMDLLNELLAEDLRQMFPKAADPKVCIYPSTSIPEKPRFPRRVGDNPYSKFEALPSIWVDITEEGGVFNEFYLHCGLNMG